MRVLSASISRNCPDAGLLFRLVSQDSQNYVWEDQQFLFKSIIVSTVRSLPAN